MKIIAVSDLHGYLPQDVPECDILLLGGDICPHFGNMRTKPGSPEDVKGQLNWLHTIVADWLDRVPAKVVVAIWGNHDFVGMHHKPNVPWVLLQDGEVTVQGVRIYGTPYTTRIYDWAFMEHDAKLIERFDRIPSGLDILISHGPPLWCCDRPGGTKGDHLGSAALYNKLSTMMQPPKAAVCGHIHGGKGRGLAMNPNKDVPIWNVAGVNEQYMPHDPMWTEITL